MKASADYGWPYWDKFPKRIRPSLVKRYYTALGRFMMMFANAETELNHILALEILDEIDANNESADQILMGLTGMMRVAAARDNLKRFLRITHKPKDLIEGVNDVFDQWGEINFFRDKIAHHATGHPSPAGHFSVSAPAREPSEFETIRFSIETLDNLAFDTYRIGRRLDFVLNPPSDDQLLDHDLRAFVKMIFEPWRYKPSQLVRTGPKHDPKFRSRARRPRSSPT